MKFAEGFVITSEHVSLGFRSVFSEIANQWGSAINVTI
jgi:hypothetical protein